jgi:hypothetical protein
VAPTRSAAKSIEHFSFSTNRRGLVNQRLAIISRSATIFISIAAWFSISNHCALGALDVARPATVHAACHGTPAAPAKSPAKSEATLCCKLLRATVVQLIPPIIQPHFAGSLQTWFAGVPALSEQFHWQRWLEPDTGPPFRQSFAESVLQRSILVHAPPVV